MPFVRTRFKQQLAQPVPCGPVPSGQLAKPVEEPYLVFKQNREALTRGIAFVLDTRPGVLLIGGEAGVGKTVLMRRLVLLSRHLGRATCLIAAHDLVGHNVFDSLALEATAGKLHLLALDGAGFLAMRHGSDSDSAAQAQCVSLFQALMRHGGKLILDYTDWVCGPVAEFLADIECLAKDELYRKPICDTVTLPPLESEEAAALINYLLDQEDLPPATRQRLFEEALSSAARDEAGDLPRVVIGILCRTLARHRLDMRTDGTVLAGTEPSA